MAMERQGHRPLLVEGSDDNLKVTTPADLPLAEFLLRLARERVMPGRSMQDPQ
jgi:2-C-methyl-D-erythritol 4-phosphate cytidylyltransferase